MPYHMACAACPPSSSSSTIPRGPTWVDFGFGDGSGNVADLTAAPVDRARHSVNLFRGRQLRLIYQNHSTGAQVGALEDRERSRHTCQHSHQPSSSCGIRFGLWEPARRYLYKPYISSRNLELPSRAAADIRRAAVRLVRPGYGSDEHLVVLKPRHPAAVQHHVRPASVDCADGDAGDLGPHTGSAAFLRCRVAWRFALMMGGTDGNAEFLLGGMLAEAHLITTESRQQRNLC